MDEQLKHYTDKLAYETDSWDLDQARKAGDKVVVVDARSADSYAAEHASAADLVSALAKLYRDNASTLTPDPLHSLVYDSHPPAALRIDHLRRAS